MRLATLAVLLVLAISPSPSPAQMVRNKDPLAGAKTWPGQEKGVAGYRVFRRGGDSVQVRSVVEKSPWYYLTDASGKRTQQLIDSVEKIEPILQADVDKSVALLAAQAEVRRKEEDDRRVELAKRVEAAKLAAREEAASLAAREDARASTAREEARTTARTDAPSGYRSGSSLGTTPTGFQLHMGPRGGIYHVSKNGKKVYEKKR